MLVAITGKAGSGKSTIAKYLVQHYGFKRYSFAKALKKVCIYILGREIDKSTDRDLLQKVGQAARNFDKNIWINKVLNQIEEVEYVYGKNNFNIVIDDVRYLNEAEVLHEHGFIIVRLIGRGYEMDESLSSHPSEREVDKICPNFVIDTSGPIEDTKMHCEKIVRSAFLP